jgi:hypothetical protein
MNKFTNGDDSHIYLEEWQDSTLDILKEIFQQSDKNKVIKFSNSNYFPSNYLNTDTVEYKTECIIKLKLMLGRFIKHIQTFGLKPAIFEPKTTKIDPPTGVIINNHNNQTQEVNISIIVQNIFEGLNNSEREELKKVLIQYDKDRNKENLIQSLQSIGKGVIEKILVEFITKPELINQIINTLS